MATTHIASVPVAAELPHATTTTSTVSSAASTPASEHHTGLHLPHLPHPHIPHLAMPHVPHPHMPEHLGQSLAHVGEEMLSAAAYMGPGIALMAPPTVQVRCRLDVLVLF